MSAVAWEPLEGYAAPSRPRLVVLPGGAGAPAVEETGGLRITRRGRLVLLALAVLALAAVLGFSTVGGASAGSAEHTVTVEAGQTLSEVAAAELPGLSISEGVLAIQLANGLSTAQVSAGQRLVVPQG